MKNISPISADAQRRETEQRFTTTYELRCPHAAALDLRDEGQAIRCSECGAVVTHKRAS